MQVFATSIRLGVCWSSDRIIQRDRAHLQQLQLSTSTSQPFSLLFDGVHTYMLCLPRNSFFATNLNASPLTTTCPF